MVPGASRILKMWWWAGRHDSIQAVHRHSRMRILNACRMVQQDAASGILDEKLSRWSRMVRDPRSRSSPCVGCGAAQSATRCRSDLLAPVYPQHLEFSALRLIDFANGPSFRMYRMYRRSGTWSSGMAWIGAPRCVERGVSPVEAFSPVPRSFAWRSALSQAARWPECCCSRVGALVQRLCAVA